VVPWAGRTDRHARRARRLSLRAGDVRGPVDLADTWDGPEFRVDPGDLEIVEVPLSKGDLLIWDSHLPHGTVRNHGRSPRAVMYVQQHPPGTDDDLRSRLEDFAAGACPPWFRWKPGHDRLDPQQVHLSDLGQRLLGTRPW
jgi:ectoine hydroxylase-related dioxygenase (phytanoyl-CoA dioxygenase family)